jgi:TIR domain
MAGSERPPDFSISRAGADAPFAAEIGRILGAAGHIVVLQQWDFANRNFMERMHAALESGARVIALLSNEYQASDHCAAEWQNAIALDPLNKEGRLIVLRVTECTPSGLLSALAYWDVVPIRGDGSLLRDVVLTAVTPGRHKDIGARAAQYWRAPRPIVHQAIRPTPSFTGREAELSSIHQLLWSAPAAAMPQPVAVHGLGGTGKSVVAREYALRNQDNYAGVWWLNAAAPHDGSPGFEGVDRALVELGATFVRDLDQVQDRAKAARQTLELIAHGGFEKPWLLVYDNVDDTRVLREWAPIGNAHVLVTSRLSGWPSTASAIEIEEWALPDAIRYLFSESGRGDLTESDAAEIAEALGRLPLALSHAAALLRARPNITAASYIASLARRMSEAPRDAEYPRGVRHVPAGVRRGRERGARLQCRDVARRLLRPGRHPRGAVPTTVRVLSAGPGRDYDPPGRHGGCDRCTRASVAGGVPRTEARIFGTSSGPGGGAGRARRRNAGLVEQRRSDGGLDVSGP